MFSTVTSILRCAYRLFQEERPVWHTIDCNVLPKDYKEENKVEKTPIVMVTEDEYPSNDKPEE